MEVEYITCAVCKKYKLEKRQMKRLESVGTVEALQSIAEEQPPSPRVELMDSSAVWTCDQCDYQNQGSDDRCKGDDCDQERQVSQESDCLGSAHEVPQSCSTESLHEALLPIDNSSSLSSGTTVQAPVSSSSPPALQSTRVVGESLEGLFAKNPQEDFPAIQSRLEEEPRGIR